MTDTSLVMPGFPDKITSEHELNLVLEHATNLGASDLFFIAGDQLMVRVYGRFVPISTRRLKDMDVTAVLSAIHSNEAETLLKSGVPLNPSYEYRSTTGHRHRYRANAVSTRVRGRGTTRVTLRTINHVPPSVEEIGLDPSIVKICSESTKGLVGFIGATGTGKSSSLAAILANQLEDPERHEHLVTIEQPIEYVYDDIVRINSLYTPLEVGKGVQSFAAGVENAMRMAPTSILVGETRDPETALATISACLSGHMAYTTLHAPGVAEAVTRLINLFPHEMHGQIRTDFCQQSVLLVAQALLPTVDGKRVAVREVLPFDDPLRERLIGAANIAQEALLATESQGQPMIADIERVHQAGLISDSVYQGAKFNYDRRRQGMQYAA